MNKNKVNFLNNLFFNFSKMTTNNNTEQIINSLVEELIKTEMKTLNERINDNFVELNNYLKHDGGKGRKTGRALLVNKIPNLTIIDIDINNNYSDEQKELIRNDLLNKLSDLDVIVKTASGGMHIYCNTNFFTVSSNRMIKCYSCSDFDIDLMSSFDESKKSLVVAANSRVRKNATEPICSYSFIRGNYNSKLTRSVNDVLNDLNIKLQIKDNQEIKAIIEKHEGVEISEELARALVDGIADFEVHNDAGNMTIEKEITLFTLFQAINSLPKQFIEEAYDNVYTFCKLTDNAKNNFENARARYSNIYTSPFVLAKILRIYQKEYYDEFVKPLIQRKALIFDIDLSEQFDLNSIIKKADNKEYKTQNEVMTDLTKVIRRIDGENIMFIKKTFDVHANKYVFSFCSNQTMKEMLKAVKLWKDGLKYFTAWEVLSQNISMISCKGVKFNSNDKNIFSLFQGYKYKVLDSINELLIKPFLNLIHEVICDNDNEIYNYVINWISYIIQNPGLKTETALVLKGLQGIGKNTFTDVISELLTGYSIKNLTEIAELTGSFNSVVEAKMLIVLNELRNIGEERLANFDSLKSIITDKTIRINEKFQPRRTAENVSNFIFVSNNAYPVKIESGDRRYVVLACNGKYKGNQKYWSNLFSLFTNEFYENLMTYFMKHDIKEFNPRIIPMTEAKQDLIEASRTPLDNWICEHYDELILGIPCSDALTSKPTEMKDKNFQLQIKDKCNRKRITIHGKRVWCYILKDECKQIYKQILHEIDEDIDIDDIPTHE